METVCLNPVASVLVCGSRRQEGHFSDIADLFRILLNDGFSVMAESRFAAYLRSNGVDLSAGVSEVSEVTDDIGAVISLGGDGTFLRVARMVGDRGIPILGINTGHLGFLASYTLADRSELSRSLRTGNACVEARTVLRMESASLPDAEWPFALNEVAVLKDATASMITVHAEVDGHFLADYLADGLVVSTATGSTAYNLSAAGPLLAPTLTNMILSPLAPHSLTLRPLVLSGSSRLCLRADSRSSYCRVAVDGRSFQVKSGTSLTVERASFCIYVIRRTGDDFASILRNKLLWGVR
ncbi:MAG: NAD(+)/NADH kinase [Muribaculaceae bacterium]|nr:NAD(+)/NADH kinase [Muribaculaceae bacterium]